MKSNSQKNKNKNKNKRPLISGVPAGFPIPASNFSQSLLDLNELVVDHPAATYFVQVQGHSMQNAGIFSGDILVIDRSKEPATGNIVVAVIDGEFTVKKLGTSGGKRLLLPENDNYRPIELTEGMNVELWGVVTYVIHKLPC